MDTFKCKICGKNHDIFKAIEIPIPEKILEIDDSEKEQRVKDLQGSYIIDENIFLLQGDIFIYKEQIDEPFFNWAVWVSLSLSDFQSKAEELKQRKNVEFDGQLETGIPFYKNTKGLKVKVVININYDYAVVKIEEESQIKKDQSKKITASRVIEILQVFYHPPS